MNDENYKTSASNGVYKLKEFISTLDKISVNKPLTDIDLKKIKSLSEK